ncbi:MAG: enterotoxin [Verrucomicrobiota bacterium]
MRPARSRPPLPPDRRQAIKGLGPLLVIASVLPWAASAIDFPGSPPGTARAEINGTLLRVGNAVLACDWTLADGRLLPRQAVDRRTQRTLDLAGTEAFRLILRGGQELAASDFQLMAKPVVRRLTAQASASVLAERFSGREIVLRLGRREPDLQVEWRAILRDGANAVRQQIVLEAMSGTVALQEICLAELPATGTQVLGTVPGSPLVLGNFFSAHEHPDARGAIGARASSSLACDFSLSPHQPVVQSEAIGVVPSGQLRRGFLYYVERERAHPYRPFLHYNAWYDICWGSRKINESECLEVIELFGRELIQQRGVWLDSFVWDDGWDDPKTLWRPIATNFPRGFTAMRAAAREQHSTLGFWLSPFGGYGATKEERIAMGRAQNFETGPGGFSLAGPNYYARFVETCDRFIDEAGANFFKFDGLARNVRETEAMLHLTRELRARKPDLFVSITTGTWPSPFWLWYGDSTWRGGDDMGFYGPGPKREQWITYRDLETYRNVVQAAPLYPLNSLMNQGFAQARYGMASELGDDPEAIRRELRSLFASGTCLQELYVTPRRLSSRNWDDLAECARWAKANADVLVDTHWIGGNPGEGQIYGWASWSPRKGIIALRNPASEAREIKLEIGTVFELPPKAPHRFELRSPWASDVPRLAMAMEVGQPVTFRLQPFQVMVFETEAWHRRR